MTLESAHRRENLAVGGARDTSRPTYWWRARCCECGCIVDEAAAPPSKDLA
jgi:hypothetical protein